MGKIVAIVLLLLGGICQAQVPVELFAGHQRASVDVMFFKYFKTREGNPQRWLFFNRSRAVVDYKQTTKTFLPQFGITGAVSYNHSKLKGIAPVVVVQVFNRGVYPKAGVQYALIKKELTIFSWLVCETLAKPDLDYFLLLRYTPKLTTGLNLFTQAESVNTLPTSRSKNFGFTQRIRLGLQFKSYQVGAGADFGQTRGNLLLNTYNAGAFIRHEF